MNFKNLLNLKTWTPLIKITSNAKVIADGLFYVGNDIYLLAQPYNSTLEEGLPETPFVTMGYWAPTSEAAKRLALHDINSEVFSTPVKPPNVLLLGGDGTYSSMLKIARERFINQYSERATYTGTPDAVFVHKTISMGRFEYSYLSREIIPYEMVYGISIDLIT